MAETFQELIAQIKDRLDIVEVVEKEVILKKQGSHYWGLCPFHKEKTPSFSVNPKLGIYKCFSCGAGGDALSFIQKTQNLEFFPMIMSLAEQFGLEVPKKFNNTESKDLKRNMLKATQRAAEFYNDMLLNHKNPEIQTAFEYLTSRGISRDIIKKYCLGVAPKSFSTLYDILKKDFSNEVLEKAGIIMPSKDAGKFIDRFRNRIIIPIQNEMGDYVAFGARTMEKDGQPKYLNSSDSMIYNKSKVLYGLYTARNAIKEEDGVILMEGYFDVISAQAHGIENAIAACGTALTPEHVKLLSRYTNSRRIYLSFDTDSAGQKATNRVAEIIKEAFQGLGNIKQFDESYISTSDDKYACEIRVICPPEGKDPDEFIRTIGADSFKQIVKNAPLLIDFQLNSILKHKNEIKTPLEKTRFVKDIIPILQEINNDIVRTEYIKMVATALSIDEKALAAEVRRRKAVPAGSVDESPLRITKIVTKNVTVFEKAQKNLLSVFFVTDNQFSFEQINEMIGDTAFTDQTLINVKSTIDKLICTVNNVKELIENLYTEYCQNPDVQGLLTELISISETFNNLTPKDFQTVIEENKNKIYQCQREKEKEQLRKLYIDAVDDDTQALKLQMQLRDKINKRLNSEKIND